MTKRIAHLVERIHDKDEVSGSNPDSLEKPQGSSSQDSRYQGLKPSRLQD